MVANVTVEEYGRLDTWVHLAAVPLVASFEKTAPEEFARVIDVNLMGQVYGTMGALPHINQDVGIHPARLAVTQRRLECKRNQETPWS